MNECLESVKLIQSLFHLFRSKLINMVNNYVSLFSNMESMIEAFRFIFLILRGET